ncbi:MAG: hypothetical protein ABW022_22960 [Actinoplanes sp.]
MSGRKLGRLIGVFVIAAALVGATAAGASADEIGDAARMILSGVDWT